MGPPRGRDRRGGLTAEPHRGMRGGSTPGPIDHDDPDPVCQWGHLARGPLSTNERADERIMASDDRGAYRPTRVFSLRGARGPRRACVRPTLRTLRGTPLTSGRWTPPRPASTSRAGSTPAAKRPTAYGAPPRGGLATRIRLWDEDRASELSSDARPDPSVDQVAPEAVPGGFAGLDAAAEDGEHSLGRPRAGRVCRCLRLSRRGGGARGA
jgi:hypothetical protein